MQPGQGCTDAEVSPLARAPPGSGLPENTPPENTPPGNTPPGNRQPGNRQPDLTVEEWDEMFAAVRARLARNVGMLLALAVGDAAAQARSALLECLEALGQLQTLLVPERDRCLRLEFEIFDLRNALALAAPELFQVPACRAPGRRLPAGA